MRRKLLGEILMLATTLITLPVMAQIPIVPVNTLVANNGSISTGDVTFSNFKMPAVLPTQVGVLLAEFGDIGASATTNADGTVSLSFVAIDPVTGLPSPLTTSPTAGGDKIRLISYTVTVTNAALRIHSIDQAFGPASAITGASALVNGLYSDEPLANVYDPLMFDTTTAPPALTRAASMASADGSGTFAGTGGILMPGGELATYNMANEFGLINGRFGTDPGGVLDSITMTYTLFPAGTPAPAVQVDLAQVGDANIRGGIFAANGFGVDPTGIGRILLTNYAQEGGAAVTLTSSDPAAVPVPSAVTVQQGYWMAAPFLVGPANVDFPTDVTLTASFNGRIQSQTFTANPATPLALQSIIGGPLQGAKTPTLQLSAVLNRLNFSPEVITFTSSNPEIAPVPASFTIPANTQPGTAFFTFPYQPQAVDTPVTFTASFNGKSISASLILPRAVDLVAVSKAELVVKNGGLKVEATSTIPTAVLSLFNAATGQFIGTMTNNGSIGFGAKYSFQGTVSPVTTLLLTSSLNGTATGAVSQK